MVLTGCYKEKGVEETQILYYVICTRPLTKSTKLCPKRRLFKIFGMAGYSSGGDSAFPVPTPDRLGTLADLLEAEETMVLPGESGLEETTMTFSGGSGGGGHNRNHRKKRGSNGGGGGAANWAYMHPPRSPSTSTTSSDISRVSFSLLLIFSLVLYFPLFITFLSCKNLY